VLRKGLVDFLANEPDGAMAFYIFLKKIIPKVSSAMLMKSKNEIRC